MRIAYVSSDRGVSVRGRNGASTHMRELANALVAAGAELTILTPRPSDGDEHTSVSCEVIDVDTEPLLTRLRRRTSRQEGYEDGAAGQASEIHGLLLNQTVLQHLETLHGHSPIDVVFERYSLWSYAGLQFARRHGLPFLLEVNAPLAAQQEEYRALFNGATAHALGDLLLASADRVIVPSQVLAEYVAARGCHPDRVRVVPCGVAREIFLSSAPSQKVREEHLAASRSRPGTDEFVIGFVGSLKPWHGLELLLDAFRELRGRTPAYHLLLVGDGPLRPMIEDYQRRHLSAGNVTITGEVAHGTVPDHLARMDVGVAPYPALPLFYFSPLKVFEYAAARVPIVASASGQIADVLEHRVSALLHAPGSVGEMVAHIEELRRDRKLGVRLARQARHVVSKGYTWDRLAARLLAVAETARRRYLGDEKSGAGPS